MKEFDDNLIQGFAINLESTNKMMTLSRTERFKSPETLLDAKNLFESLKLMAAHTNEKLATLSRNIDKGLQEVMENLPVVKPSDDMNIVKDAAEAVDLLSGADDTLKSRNRILFVQHQINSKQVRLSNRDEAAEPGTSRNAAQSEVSKFYHQNPEPIDEEGKSGRRKKTKKAPTELDIAMGRFEDIVFDFRVKTATECDIAKTFN